MKGPARMIFEGVFLCTAHRGWVRNIPSLESNTHRCKKYNDWNTWQPGDRDGGLRWQSQRQRSKSRLRSRGQGDRPHPQHQPGQNGLKSETCVSRLLAWKVFNSNAFWCFTRTKGSTRRFLLLRLAVLVVVSPGMVEMIFCRCPSILCNSSSTFTDQVFLIPGSAFPLST